MSKVINTLDENRGIFKIHESFTSDEEYNLSNCLSYSKLKDLHDNPEVLTKEREDGDKEWLTFGTMVDLMLTTPKEVDNRIFVNDKVPSEQFKNIAEYMVGNNLIDPILLTDEQVEEVYTASGSAVKWLPDTKRKKIIEECTSYLNLLTTHKGKIIVTTEQFLEAQKIAEVFKTHPWTKQLFMSEEEQLANHIEIFYQYRIKYIFEGLQCKSKFDIIVVDHDQMLISPFDIKTGSDTPRNFMRYALYKYKYCYQGVLYKEGLKKFIEKIDELKDYEIDEFRFVYVSRLKPTFPLTLEMSERCHIEIRDIGIDNLSYHLPSLVNIMEEAEDYINQINEGKIPTVPYDIALANGVIILNEVDNKFHYVF
jgi:hypothetical protein